MRLSLVEFRLNIFNYVIRALRESALHRWTSVHRYIANYFDKINFILIPAVMSDTVGFCPSASLTRITWQELSRFGRIIFHAMTI